MTTSDHPGSSGGSGGSYDEPETNSPDPTIRDSRTVPDPGPIPPHRLTGLQALEVSCSVPWATDPVSWLRLLYVSWVDEGKACANSYLTQDELEAIRAGIQRVAPRV